MRASLGIFARIADVASFDAIGDTADAGDVAVVARAGLRVHHRASREKVGREVLDTRANHSLPRIGHASSGSVPKAPSTPFTFGSNSAELAMPSNRTSLAVTFTVAIATTSSPSAARYANNCGCDGRSPYQSAVVRRPLL